VGDLRCKELGGEEEKRQNLKGKKERRLFGDCWPSSIDFIGDF